MPSLRRLLPVFAIFAVTVLALVVIWPSEPGRFLPSGIPWPEGRGVSIGGFERKEMRLGLDLQGGTRLLLGASLPEGAEGELDDAIDGTLRVLRRRVDASGVSEAEITRQGSSGISVQLPGLTPTEARALLGRTALLRFCEPAGISPGAFGFCDTAGQWQQASGTIDGRQVALTGRFLRPNAYVSADGIGNPILVFEWQGDGPQLSEQVTRRLLGQPLGIFLDNEPLSTPTVQAVISDRGTITGLPLNSQGARTGARDLARLLNAGALEVQLTVRREQQVDATLGEDSVTRSVLAGEIGLLLVVLFMVLYYRVPGVLAALALVTYSALTLAIYKLIPVTLTLAGIGAFVLSVGMAVDANVLIFERLKEELRSGRSYVSALDPAFNRAWPSIRDSNVATLITTAILFSLGGGIDLPVFGAFEAPLVQGFAATLAIGVLVSMFSAVVVTRTLLRLLIGTAVARRLDWLGADLRPPPEREALPGEGSAAEGEA
jgi:preprotein translocase subunit SecD